MLLTAATTDWADCLIASSLLRPDSSRMKSMRSTEETDAVTSSVSPTLPKACALARAVLIGPSSSGAAATAASKLSSAVTRSPTLLKSVSPMSKLCAASFSVVV